MKFSSSSLGQVATRGVQAIAFDQFALRHAADTIGNMQAFERVLRSRRYPTLYIRSTVTDDEGHFTVFPAIVPCGLMVVLAPSRWWVNGHSGNPASSSIGAERDQGASAKPAFSV